MHTSDIDTSNAMNSYSCKMLYLEIKKYERPDTKKNKYPIKRPFEPIMACDLKSLKKTVTAPKIIRIKYDISVLSDFKSFSFMLKRCFWLSVLFKNLLQNKQIIKKITETDKKNKNFEIVILKYLFCMNKGKIKSKIKVPKAANKLS